MIRWSYPETQGSRASLGRVEPPLQVVALDDPGAGTSPSAARCQAGRMSNQHRARRLLGVRLARRDPDEPVPRQLEDLGDRPRPGRERSQFSWVSVAVTTSPPGVRS